jgi:anaerobic selenocysteine-containing dehydrogenase
MGTYDALALGLAHILVEQGWHDKAFIEAHTAGFDRFQDVLKDYTPAATAERTGIPEDRIRRLAQQLHASRPSVVVVDARSLSTSNGLEIARATLALNALLGNLERPGGIVARRDLPLADWNALKPDGIASAGLAKPALDGRGQARFPFSSSVSDAFPESVLDGAPYAAEALFLYYSNPLFSRNNPDRFRQAFAKIPFIVSFSPFMDESAHEADLILPDHTYLERWEEALPPPLGFRATIGIRKPVVEPLYGTKHSGDAVIGIARNLGGTVADAFPWKDFRAAMEERLAGIARAKRGSIVEDDEADFLKKLAKVGCWNDEPSPPENWKAAFRTASGKFEFYSQAAEAKIARSAAIGKLSPTDYLKSIGKGAVAEACLPHAEPAYFEGAEKDFPMLLFAYKDITYAEGSGANIPLLVELAGLQKGLTGTESWLSWAEINVETAARLGLAQGDAFWVESPLGKIKVHALLREKIAPDLVLMPLGRGHTQMGRFARGKGENPKHIMAAHIDPLSGIVSNRITRVRIAKA